MFSLLQVVIGHQYPGSCDAAQITNTLPLQTTRNINNAVRAALQHLAKALDLMED